MYNAFNQIKTQVTRNLQILLSEQENHTTPSLPTETQLSGALSLGLTYINRLQTSAPLLSPTARILLISTSTDSKGQYIPIMNAIFAAQKSKIPIDVVRITEEVEGRKTGGFLQQAAFTTGGVYTPLQPNAVSTSLAQYLLQLYACDQATRNHLVFPKRYRILNYGTYWQRGSRLSSGMFLSSQDL